MKEFVAFFLSGKLYGADIAHMQGIEPYQELVPAKDLPGCLQGLVNIRGDLIPVVDIRKHLTLPPTGITDETKYIIFLTRNQRLACRIDGISNIFKAEDANIKGMPELTQTGDIHCLDCIVKNGNDLILIINPDNLLSDEDWEQVRNMFAKIEEEKQRLPDAE